MCVLAASDSATPWTATRQAPLSMGFFRQEYWSGLPFPSPGDLAGPEIKVRSPALQADLLTELRRKPVLKTKPPRSPLPQNEESLLCKKAWSPFT